MQCHCMPSPSSVASTAGSTNLLCDFQLPQPHGTTKLRGSETRTLRHVVEPMAVTYFGPDGYLPTAQANHAAQQLGPRGRTIHSVNGLLATSSLVTARLALNDASRKKIDRLKGDDLGAGACLDQLCFQSLELVMGKDHLVGAGVADALNHGGVVLFIRKHHHIWDVGGQGAQGRQIRNIAGREQQGTLFAVQVRQLAL